MDLQSKVAELKFSRDVLTCAPETRMSKVIATLQKSRIGSIVITEKEKVVGIFTERDFLLKIGKDFEKLKDTTIEEHMTPNPKGVLESSPVIKVLEMMHEGRFRHVLVTGPSQELVGIISIKDMMEYLITNVKTLEEELSDLVAAIV